MKTIRFIWILIGCLGVVTFFSGNPLLGKNWQTEAGNALLVLAQVLVLIDTRQEWAIRDWAAVRESRFLLIVEASISFVFIGFLLALADRVFWSGYFTAVIMFAVFARALRWLVKK